LELNSQPEGTVFGWRYTDAEDGMTNALTNGQFCRSGFAVYLGSYAGVCSSIQRISSDFGQVEAPYKCSVANPSNTCRYYYSTNDYLTQQCQCGFDPTIGYCPYPGQKELSAYTSSLLKVLQVSECHSLDRYNLRAQAEQCGMGPQIELKAAISIAFNFTQWPYIQNERAAQCMVNIHPLSEINILRSGAVRVGALGALVMLSLSLFL
jgi:hypothetical protein